MTTMRDNLTPLYGWLLLFGLFLFGAFLLWHFELLQQLHERDRTWLSIVILVLFVLTTLYLGWCALRLAQENRLVDDPDADAGGWAADHLRLIRQLQASGSDLSSEPLLARLVEQVHFVIDDQPQRLGIGRVGRGRHLGFPKPEAAGSGRDKTERLDCVGDEQAVDEILVLDPGGRLAGAATALRAVTGSPSFICDR